MIKGRVWKFGDNIDTDILAPTASRAITDPIARARQCLVAVRPEFGQDVQPGDVVVAGRNFGCGSSRETATQNLKRLGVACVVAPTFSRIFQRNSINLGLPVFECDDAPRNIDDGDIVEIDLPTGRIVNLSSGQTLQARPFPDFLLEIIQQGGMLNFARAKIAARKIAAQHVEVDE